ncbi:hypothetical protein CHS0354_025942 [Potamilus streckersoni]|uniref:Uncharacterized protein n=1 Tax=Potamilus streckersoni TaxID=2493646 RepID=A0AAE0T4Q9_9BIVA|nr:hypothetical protein CHS0354_025942 [Potamilus streckersoni]
MTLDNIRIINIQGVGENYTRYDRDNCYDRDNRFSFLERLVHQHQPTVLLLDDPYDGDSFRSVIFRKYEKVQSDMNENIVMLYDKDRVSAQKQRDLKPNFQYLNPDNIVIPNIEILSPLPIQTVINRFACVTWSEATIYEENRRNAWMEELISYSQHIAMTRNLPILMGGDFKFPIPELKKLVNTRNKSVFSDLREKTQPMFDEIGIGLASQVDYQLGRHKRLLTMKVHEVQGTMSRNDCFIASQELRLRDPSFISIEELWSTAIYMYGEKECQGGRPEEISNQTTMNGHYHQERPTQFCPTKTDIYVPPRPPKHHGG